MVHSLHSGSSRTESGLERGYVKSKSQTCRELSRKAGSNTGEKKANLEISREAHCEVLCGRMCPEWDLI